MNRVGQYMKSGSALGSKGIPISSCMFPRIAAFSSDDDDSLCVNASMTVASAFAYKPR